MSLKPDKKSDKGKSWMKPRKDVARKVKVPYHLVVTEGTKTEPNYFMGLKNTINGNDGFEKVHLEIFGEGMNTVSLMAKAKQLARNAGNPYQHIWIVYDKDDFSAENFNSVVDLCRTATEESSETKYHAIWSNQCVELWYLLHFSYFHSDISRDEYYPKLTQYLKKINLAGTEKIGMIYLQFFSLSFQMRLKTQRDLKMIILESLLLYRLLEQNFIPCLKNSCHILKT